MSLVSGRLFWALREACVTSLRMGAVLESFGDYDTAAEWYARAEADACMLGIRSLSGAAERGIARVASLEASRRIAEREAEAEYHAMVERASWGLW